MMKRNSILVFGSLCMISLFLLGACGPEKKETQSRGMIAKMGDGVKRLDHLTSAEIEQICANHYCEPNYLYHVDFGGKPKPDAPEANANETQDYSRKILNLPSAWKVTEGSRQIVVAVVDTGVDFNHEDLKDNIWTNDAEKNGVAGVDDDQNGFVDDVYGWDFANNKPNALDDHRHGTHCGGIIGAEKNKKGTIGVSPLVKIMPVKFLSADGWGDTEAAIKAIQYATQNGAKIISNSWGGGGFSKLLDEAIQAAHAKGIIVVAAAGNYSSNNDESPMYPANYPGVVSVASTDSQDALSSFSNFGQKTVTIAAPGSKIYSALLENAYGELSGTSMACPQVAGALALGWAAHPEWDAATLKTKMCESAKKIHTDVTICGRLDVGAFLK